MAFKMKNPSMYKMAKQAGSGSPMKVDNGSKTVEPPRKLKKKLEPPRLKRADKPTKKPTITNKKRKKFGGDLPASARPPQPPKPGTVRGITHFEYDMNPFTKFGNKYLGKTRGKIRDYFFKK